MPTYMILSESFEPKKFKRDKNFDRRDLYIITQNALADAFYNQYIRNHYSTERPAPRGWVDKWLGRDKHFPKAPLVLPRQEDIMAIYQGAMERRQREPGAPDPNSDPTVLNSMVGGMDLAAKQGSAPLLCGGKLPDGVVLPQRRPPWTLLRN